MKKNGFLVKNVYFSKINAKELIFSKFYVIAF